MRTAKLIIFLLLLGNAAAAQKKLNLLECVQYAMDSNLTIKQTALQENFSAIALKQSKLAQIPNLSFSTNGSLNSSGTQNPNSFAVATQSYLSNNIQLQSSGEIFNWFSKKNTIAANEWEYMASLASTEKLKNDIALAVANFYLQVLLAQEQVNITSIQLSQSKAQLVNTRKLVDAGALPELNAAELESQVAVDSSNVISAKGNVTQSLISLKAYMGLDADKVLEIDAPPVESIPLLSMAELQPDVVYASAIANLPQQKYNDLKYMAAVKNSAVAKAGMYPTLGGFGSMSSIYIDSKAAVYDQVLTGTTSATPLVTTVNGTQYTVNSLNFSRGSILGYNRSDAYFIQLSDNFRYSVGLNLSIPIFSGGSLRANYERSRITIRSWDLQKRIDNQKLKQDIYTAFNNAVVALEKFNASKKAVETSERSYFFAKKRYDIGMSSTIELITNQNNLFTQRLQLSLNQFDYVFKMKVLEFYRGQGLKF